MRSARVYSYTLTVKRPMRPRSLYGKFAGFMRQDAKGVKVTTGMASKNTLTFDLSCTADQRQMIADLPFVDSIKRASKPKA